MHETHIHTQTCSNHRKPMSRLLAELDVVFCANCSENLKQLPLLSSALKRTQIRTPYRCILDRLRCTWNAFSLASVLHLVRTAEVLRMSARILQKSSRNQRTTFDACVIVARFFFVVSQNIRSWDCALWRLNAVQRSTQNKRAPNTTVSNTE